MSKHIYLLLTQLTVIVHMLFILFVVVGGFLARRRLWLMIVDLCSVGWAIFVELASEVACPLTAVENFFGYRAGLSTYKDDFITRYLVPIIYQDGLTPNIQFILVGVVVGVNVIAYWPRIRVWS